MEFLTGVFLLDREICQGTQDLYRWSVGNFTDWLGRAAELRDVRVEWLNRWVRDRMKAGAASKTMANKRADLIALRKHAALVGLVDEGLQNSERLRRIKSTVTVPVAWSLDEVENLVVAAGKIPGDLGDGATLSAYFGALISVGYATGLRRGDLMRVEVADVAATSGGAIVSTIQEKTKNLKCSALDSKTFELFMGLARMRQMVAAGCPLKWPNSAGSFYRKFDWIKKSAGISGGGYLQQLRRTGATECEIIRDGGGAEYCGHARAGVAARHYIDRSRLPVLFPPVLFGRQSR